MSYANAWLKWFDVIEQGAGPLSTRMIELADIGGADIVLDIGTGIGEPAVSAAMRLDDNGRVLAIDRDPSMIAIGQERAEARGVSNVEFVVSDVETMDLASCSLDAVLARWSMMFVGDLTGVLVKLARALRRGGHLVTVVWESPSEVPALSLAKCAVHRHFSWPEPTYGPHSSFALSDIAITKKLIVEAGFDNVYGERFAVSYEFASPADYIQNRLDLTGPIWEGMESDPMPVRRAAFSAIEEAMEPYRTSSGSYRMVNQAYCIAGRIG